MPSAHHWPGESTVLTVFFTEPLNEATEQTQLQFFPPLPDLVISGPERVAETTNYVWSIEVGAEAEENSYSFEVSATDAIGNVVDNQMLVDEDGNPLELSVQPAR